MNLAHQQPISLYEGEQPEQASAKLECSCGEISAHTAEVAFVAHDDDHFGRLELWFETELAGKCPGCARSLCARLRFTVTSWPSTGQRELGWDGHVAC